MYSETNRYDVVTYVYTMYIRMPVCTYQSTYIVTSTLYRCMHEGTIHTSDTPMQSR